MSWRLLLPLGLVTHLVFLASIFDIYFTSPIVHGMAPQKPLQPPPAARLVLISADGLRADKFYSRGADGRPLAPFLCRMARTRGVWGVSHTRVPTESRPGHVALVAGVYEDPSAVTRGWQENPVPFDTVFNQSSHTWAWGSPDIVPMLAKGATPGRVDTFTYDAHEQDFARGLASELDGWVFDRVSEFLRTAAGHPATDARLRQQGTVLFLHLLGLDTTGHGHKPQSSQYADNIRFVDAGLEKLIGEIDKYFNDSRTLFVFSSDHGMTDWGSHGAGDPSETQTPLVAWGAGIRGPLPAPDGDPPPDAVTAALYAGRAVDQGMAEEGEKRGEGRELLELRRTDVAQADIAPLVTALLGLNLPVNSVGRLPPDVLGVPPDQRADLLFTNARQLLCQYETRRQQRRAATAAALYWEHGRLAPHAQTQMVNKVLDYMQKRDWDNAMFLIGELMDLALAGMHYYHTYDRPMLQTAVTLCYLGWMLLLASHLVKTSGTSVPAEGPSAGGPAALAVGVVGTSVAVFLIVAKSLPAHYAVYLLLPVLLWSVLAYDVSGLWAVRAAAGDRGTVLRHGAVLVGIELLVVSFFQRWVLSVLLLALAPWPLTLPKYRKRLTVLWVGSSVLLAGFPLSPVITHQANYLLVKAAAMFSAGGVALASLSGELRLFRPVDRLREPRHCRLILLAQVALLAAAAGVTHAVQSAVGSRSAVPGFVHVASWTMLALSWLLPCLSSAWLLNRLLHVTAALLVPFLLLSLGREALFLPLLALHLYSWTRLEHTSEQKQLAELSFDDPLRKNEARRPAQFGDTRRAFFYLLFVMFAFFGIGNIASVNSFDPTCVYAFVTVFSPWVMGALLLTKILVPFLLVCCYGRAVATVTRMSTQRLFLTVLLMSDVMSVHFFFLVTDAGSWQDIGFSISHHVIATGTSCFLLILHGAARVLTSATWWSPVESVLTERRRSRVDRLGGGEIEVSVVGGSASQGIKLE
ncbi:GPI ethanolamine phosphate transferase 1-like [Amphibalanus amphitrite]|uniref:GPI ethanolamine phosphate transferase 1-like n=1 Tax=Amphibalanus amphitrite TaxID=1232801 RepID=UPI001C910316|nr:GPI ethanolamine phosphate transferase 1-like [Amphibalanus amphitrite]XP_043199493.1 GPI ethanolamine phosphate transferase 1-like [Amphibalanus amphitrite]